MTRTVNTREENIALVRKVLAVRDYNTVGGSLHRSYHDAVHQLGLNAGGYYPDTGQAALRVKFDQNKPLKEQLAAARFVSDLRPDSNGVTRFGVFEESLAEHGVFEIEMEEAGIRLVVWVYGQKRLIKTFPTLFDCLEYVYENHPYERLKKVRKRDKLKLALEQAKEALELAQQQGDFSNGVTANGIDEGDARMGEVLSAAIAHANKALSDT